MLGFLQSCPGPHIAESQAIKSRSIDRTGKSQFGKSCNNYANKEHQWMLKPVGESFKSKRIFI